MNILIFNLNGRSGMLDYSSQFANAMVKKHTVYVVFPSYGDHTKYSDDLWLLRIKAPPSIFGSIIQTLNISQHFKLMKAIKKFNPDVVHIMDNHPWYLLYAKCYKKKLFVTQHDPTLHMGDQKGFMRWLTNLVNVKLRKWAKKVFVHGQKIKESIVDIPQEKIELTVHGDYSFFTKGVETFEHIKEGDVLFFGRLLPYKGWEDVFKAAKDLKQYKFTVAGEGNINDFQLSKELNQKNIMSGCIENEKIINSMKNIQFINRHINDSEVADLFRKHKIVVLPYKDASQTGIIPIAYSFKKPVIATKVGALPDVVKNGLTGILIEPNDPDALKRAIEVLLKMDIKNMGELCYKFMQDNLSWDKITDKVVEAYEIH